MRLVALLLHALAALIAAGLGVLCILQGLGTFAWSDVQDFATTSLGEVVLFTLGGVLLFAAFHFLLGVWRSRATGLRFSQEGEWGRIELSAHALREFISGILRDEVRIDRFRVRMRRMQGGIAIAVEIGLSPQEKVGEVGRRIQGTLARRVAERTGVEVKEVAVLVESIRSRGEHEGREEDTNAYYQP